MARRDRISWGLRAGLGLLAVTLPCAASAQDADGWHVAPSLYWKSGDQRLDLSLVDRFRVEGWDAFSSSTEFYTANRARIRLSYAWRDLVSLTGEVQDLRLNGLSPDLTGPGATYRANSGGGDHAGDTAMRQLFLELRPAEGAFVRAGRQDVKLGAEASYSEPDWRYLKTSRLGERLVGTVGWTQAERAYDGVAAGLDRGGHLLYAFAAHPTTGLFDVDSAYRDLRPVGVAGLSWTVKRDTWLPNTELESFALAYRDDRSTDHGGLPKGVLIYTVGGSYLGVGPLGPGRVDLLLWGAGQWGRYSTLHQGAEAGMAELGYQLPWLPARPWLRLGVNAASGDTDPSDSHHGTFFNVLPTNHPYYGFADQLAFQNLVNSFLQLRLAPHESPTRAPREARAQPLRAPLRAREQERRALLGERRLQRIGLRLQRTALPGPPQRRNGVRRRRNADAGSAPHPGARLLVPGGRRRAGDQPRSRRALRLRLDRGALLRLDGRVRRRAQNP